MKNFQMRQIHIALLGLILLTGMCSQLIAAGNDQEFKFYDPFSRLNEIPETTWDSYILETSSERLRDSETAIKKDLLNSNTTEDLRKVHFITFIRRSVELTAFVDQKSPSIPKEYEADVANAKFWSHFSKLKYSSDFEKLSKATNIYINSNFNEILKVFVERTASQAQVQKSIK